MALVFFLRQYCIAQSPSLKLTEMHNLNDNEGVVLGEIAAAVFGVDQSLYLLDNSQNSIHKFDNNGKYLFSFGREGRGPGEFLRASDTMALDIVNNQIYVLDYPNGRIVIYDGLTGEHENTIRLESTTAIPLNQLFVFNGRLLLLGSHLDEDLMVHEINQEGVTVQSLGEFINFNNFVHNNNGKMQLSQVHASSLGDTLMIGLAAPNRIKLFDSDLLLINEIENDDLPRPWESHMTMQPGRYRSTFYSASFGNQILSDEYYLYFRSEVLNPEGPEIVFHAELRNLTNASIVDQLDIGKNFILASHRLNQNKVLLLMRDEDYEFKIYTIDVS